MSLILLVWILHALAKRLIKTKAILTIDEASAICDVLDIGMDDYFLIITSQKWNENHKQLKEEFKRMTNN